MKERIHLLKDNQDAAIGLRDIIPMNKFKSQNWKLVAVSKYGLDLAYKIRNRHANKIDFLFSEAIYAPNNEECEVARVSEGEEIVINEDLVEAFGIKYDYIYGEAHRKHEEKILSYIYQYRKGKPFESVRDQVVLLVDNGSESGLKFMTALKAVLAQKPKAVYIAAPVIPSDVLEHLEPFCDDIFFMYDIDDYVETSLYYKNFEEIDEERIEEILGEKSSMKYDSKIELVNKTEEYSFGDVARQANGSAWLKSGDTVILATVVIDETEIVKDDFLPLTVQYIEKTYAAGKMPGGFFKRETKPGDFETLTSRIVDRSLRPLFPKGFGHPTQITIMVFSVDKESDLQTLALNAASAALYVSDIDINTSVSAIRAAKIDGELVLNPTLSQLKESTLDLYLSGTKDDLLMIEMRTLGSEDVEMSDVMADPMLDPGMGAVMLSKHSSNAMNEDELIDIFEKTQTALFESNAKYETSFNAHKKETKPLECKAHAINEEMLEYVKANHIADITAAMNQMAKSERSTALRELRKSIIATKTEWADVETEVELKDAIERVKREQVRAQILNDKVRADGRALDEVRPITIDTNVLPSAHSSCLFTRGQTQALVVLTLGGVKDAQMFETLTEEGTQDENFMVHYNFPGFSVGEASPVMGVKRRELGHGNLAKRALEPIVDVEGQTIRLVSEILESNGSSSMATVCGGYMALKAADIDTSDTVAGIAMGMVSEGDKYAVLSDIMGLEDHDGDMDFKVTGSKDGITAMQMDIKLGGISLEVLKEALYQAKEGRSHIIDIMLEAESKIEFNDGVLPSTDFFHIDPSFIGDVIGQAGKNIREIIEKFEVAIDIDKKDGKVKVTGKNKSGVAGAREHIEEIVSKPKVQKIKYEVGDKYPGIVKKIVDFGAFIELPDGTDGLLHISKVAKERVEKVSDVLSEGDEVSVEILEFKGNKISLGRVF